MIAEFQEFIDQHSICTKEDRILIGLSGGIDSVCLLHLFIQQGYKIGIAHCNFKLREEESDQDQLFVRYLAEQFDLPFFTTEFNTKEIAEKEGISIQMAARDLRYEWFEQVRLKHGYKYIAIAHNKNDQVETFLINLTRGSGIKGLSGINTKAGNIIRPLLFAGRNEIEAFIQLKDIDFREDSSNKSTKYSRNLIRHEIIPLFEKINPRFKDTIIENINRLKETEDIYLKQIAIIKEELISIVDDKVLILINKLKQLNSKASYLHEILNPYGFTHSQITDIIESLGSNSGKQFFSPTYKLIKDRSHLIIQEISAQQNKYYTIQSDVDILEFPVKLEILKYERDENFNLLRDINIGLFDLDKLEFPLILRKWKKGDYFMPLGMDNLKKLSDFFINSKVSIIDKENTWILESNNKIVWVIGHRIDDRFKITSNTKNIMQIKLSI